MFSKNPSAKSFWRGLSFRQMMDWRQRFVTQLSADWTALAASVFFYRPLPPQPKEALHNLANHRPHLFKPQNRKIIEGRQSSILIEYELENGIFLAFSALLSILALVLLLGNVFPLAAEHWSLPFVLRRLPFLLLWTGLTVGGLWWMMHTLLNEGRRTVRIQECGQLLPAQITNFSQSAEDGVSYLVINYEVELPGGRRLCLQYPDNWNFTFLKLQTPDGQQWAGLIDRRTEQFDYPPLLTVGTPLAVLYISDAEVYLL